MHLEAAALLPELKGSKGSSTSSRRQGTDAAAIAAARVRVSAWRRVCESNVAVVRGGRGGTVIGVRAHWSSRGCSACSCGAVVARYGLGLRRQSRVSNTVQAPDLAQVVLVVDVPAKDLSAHLKEDLARDQRVRAGLVGRSDALDAQLLGNVRQTRLLA